MSYLMFAMVELLGLILMFAAWKNIFQVSSLAGIIMAFFFMITMLGLSFHVMARKPRPDSTSIRMACFASVLWYGVILSAKLALEGRAWPITIAALLFTCAVAITASFATWAVLARPLEFDVGEE